MGLDQYLYAERFASDYDFCPESERNAYQAVAKAFGLDGPICTEAPHAKASVCVAYWRKAYSIHSWFDGKLSDLGNGQRAYVERAVLVELRDLVTDCCTLRDSAPFTSQPDDWFWADMENTREMLAKVLDTPSLNDDDIDFYYEANW